MYLVTKDLEVVTQLWATSASRIIPSMALFCRSSIDVLQDGFEI